MAVGALMKFLRGTPWPTMLLIHPEPPPPPPAAISVDPGAPTPAVPGDPAAQLSVTTAGPD